MAPGSDRNAEQSRSVELDSLHRREAKNGDQGDFLRPEDPSREDA